MKSLQTPKRVILYFQVHQPKRIDKMNFFDIGTSKEHFDDDLNGEITRRVATECYLPTNALLLEILRSNPTLKVVFSISGIALEQFEHFAPEVLQSFRALVQTGSVELLGETYYHSLASFLSGDEFESQVVKHSEKIYEHFQVRPQVFRNTELIYNNEIGKRVSMLGYQGIITEGIDGFALHNDTNRIRQHPTEKSLKILVRNYRLSDDIAFRFNDSDITADKFIGWIDNTPIQDDLITLGMDYETFGEHHKQKNGILNFLQALMAAFASHPSCKLVAPGEVIQSTPSAAALDVPQTISWADQERDVSAWLGNDMQRDAFYAVTRMENAIKSTGDQNLLHEWRNLLTSDHFYYMSTKKDSDGRVHSYFSHYPSPYEAFINYMNVIADLAMVVRQFHDTQLEKASIATEIERHKQVEAMPTWAMAMEGDQFTPYRH